MEDQEARGARPGGVMADGGMVSQREIHQAQAEEWGLPFIDHTAIEMDQRLLERFDQSKAMMPRMFLPAFMSS